MVNTNPMNELEQKLLRVAEDIQSLAESIRAVRTAWTGSTPEEKKIHHKASLWGVCFTENTSEHDIIKNITIE